MSREINAKNLGLTNRIDVTTGDVLDSISNSNLFDSIFWALPFGFLNTDTKISLEEMQVFDPGYRAIYKFFRTGKRFLKPNGKLLIGFSPDLGHQDLLYDLAKESNLNITKVNKKELMESQKIKFELLSGNYSGL